jgi:acyl-CoA synthetase (AMP-forming)/AMP-acid ligase II
MLTAFNNEINTVRELVDRRANTQPDLPFLISPETGRVLTFKGLQEQAHHLSRRFRQMGLEFGDKVAFLMDNGLFTAQLFLGAMYGGFVSVPLSVRAGVSQLSYTLDHCDAKVVFVGSQYNALIKEIMAQVGRPIEIISADIDSCPEVSETPSITDPLPPLGAAHAALLMYSSGTTGRPNGAIHTHRSVLAHGRNSARSHQLTAADRSLLVLPLYHINAECVTLLPTLVSGGSVVVPHGFAVSEFWNWLDDYRCTWSALVPFIISQLLDWKDPKAECRAAAFQRIRFLRTSSAPLSPSLHREFLDKFKLLLIQAMGSSEAGNVFSNPLPPGSNKIGSPGLPWGFETKIVDREGAELPAGEPGEVLIRGDGMMQGYYKDPAGTAAALDAEGWLHTGDLAYRDEDGYFFVVGRSKELVIKGGMNIAPKQIDEVLEAHPAVLEAAAVGVPDRYLGEDLIAFVVMRTEKVVEEGELLDFCENRLGHFKTPTRIHIVKDLPKGPSGKVQRLKLQEDAARRSVSEPASCCGKAAGRGDADASPVGSVVPSTPIEQIIAEIWAKLLTLPQVDLHSNFFSLGGHSLLAIQCLSLLRERLPIVLSLSDFFENATVAQQAALIRRRLRPDDVSSVDSTATWEQELLLKVGSPAADDAIPPRDRSLPCPLSPNQLRIWFTEQLSSGAPVYNEAEAVRLRGELNVDLVEKALNVIIARHEILRTTIQTGGDEPLAVVHESWPLRLKQIDLSLLPPSQREAEIERLLIDEPRLPYRLETEPGIRAALLRLGQNEHVFILMMHHIVCDWSSEGVLWRELSALYRAGCSGQPLELPALPIQHGDYAVWQQQRVTRNNLAEDLSYWDENLRGAPPLLDLPTDKLRPHTISYRGARQRFRIPSKLGLALRNCSQREGVSLFTVFAAALSTLLYRYSGQEDILVGIPLADRDRPELQSMIGFLLHTHVLRTQLSGDLTFRVLLARVQKGVLDLYAHRSPPFNQVVNRVQPHRNLSYSPIFQVMLNWRDRDQQLSFIGLNGLEVESLLAESRTSKFDLTLMLTDGGDSIDLEIEYSTDLFDDDRIERMFGHFHTLLEGAATNPEQPLADLPLLTSAERQKLVFEWNRTEVV